MNKGCHFKSCSGQACWVAPDGRKLCVQHGKGVKGKRRPYHIKDDSFVSEVFEARRAEVISELNSEGPQP